jgi:hypothetical protein
MKLYIFYFFPGTVWVKTRAARNPGERTRTGSAFASTRERVPVEPALPRPKPAHSYYEWNEGRRPWAWVDPGQRLDHIHDRMLGEFRG